jgi:DNA-binding IclR family transcriptional regulator
MSNLAVERALILLRYIVDNPGGLSIREASRNLGYSPATVQTLIQALQTQGYVVQDKETERYHLGSEAVQLGLAALSRLNLRRIAHPHLERLSEQSQETALLAIARGNHAIYVDKVVSPQPIRMDAPLGVQRPYNCTAVGKILLTDQSDEKIEQLAIKGVFEQRTDRSITDVVSLRSEIEKVRQQGHALDHGEYTAGLHCVAAPIYNHEGNLVAALTISGPAERLTTDLEGIIRMTKDTALAISEEMGYRSNQVEPGALGASPYATNPTIKQANGDTV